MRVLIMIIIIAAASVAAYIFLEEQAHAFNFKSVGKGFGIGLFLLLVAEIYRPKGSSSHVVKKQQCGNTTYTTYLKKEPGGYVTQKEQFERSRGRGEWNKQSRSERFLIRYALLLFSMIVSFFIFKSPAGTIGLGVVLAGMTFYLIAKK